MLEVEGGIDLRVVGHGHSATCATVETMTECDDLATPSVERGEFQAVLISLGTAIADKETVVGEATQLSNLLRESRLEWVDDAVRVEGYVVELVGNRFYVARVAMADGYHRMATI